MLYQSIERSVFCLYLPGNRILFMKTAFTLLLGLSLNLVLETHAQLRDGKPTETRVTHGPMLGRPAPDSMSLWVRTERPGKVRVLYGTKRGMFTQEASIETTDITSDNTAIITINKLNPNTRYYYRIADHQLEGPFHMTRGLYIWRQHMVTRV